MNDWLGAFPALGAIGDPAFQRAREVARRVELDPGEVVFRHGDRPQSYLLVLKGRVRVQAVTDTGREIVLYRLESGQSCVLTTSCLIAGEPYPAEGVAETEVAAMAIPAEWFRVALAESAGFRDFVFTAYGQRLSSLILLVRDMASRRLEARLAGLLLEQADGQQAILATHQDLAAELGTAREVISRQLKEMERAGWLTLRRGAVEILDPQALRHLADGS
jgi:CRP/FNR family transcriptional regulator